MTQPDPAAQGGSEGAQSGVPGNTGPGTAGAGADPGTGTQSGAPVQAGEPNAGNDAETVSKAEYDRRIAQLSAADQRASKAEAELKQLRDKDLPAMEKLTRENAELVAERDKLSADLKQTRLENAFFNDNTYEWKNPKTALKLADLSKVEIDEDGTVHNLKGALDALAKAEPYLIKEPSGEDDKDKGGKGSTGALGTGGAQGTQPNAVKGLAARLPALRTRGITGS